jgi:hypothetical protein
MRSWLTVHERVAAEPSATASPLSSSGPVSPSLSLAATTVSCKTSTLDEGVERSDPERDGKVERKAVQVGQAEQTGQRSGDPPNPSSAEPSATASPLSSSGPVSPSLSLAATTVSCKSFVGPPRLSVVDCMVCARQPTKQKGRESEEGDATIVRP